MNDTASNDPRLYAIPDIHGHAKGEHKAFSDERPIPLSARMLFLWFYHACRRGWPRFLMVTDHMNYLTFEDPAAINLVRRALKLAQAGDLYGAAETASVEVGHAAVVSEGLRRGMRYSIGAEVDNDPRSRPDAQNIVDAMKPDGMIRSVHFLTVDHPAHGPNWNWPFDNPEFADVYETVGTAKTWELYMTALLDAIERLPGNILGHFYVPAAFGHWPDDATLDAYENQIVDACEARGMAIEFNTRFLYRDHSEEERAKYLAAHRRLLAKCKAKNVGIAVGSDAHSPKDQGRGFETVLALLDECEINELVFPIAGRLARVALRVERKVEAVSELASPLEERRAARKARPSETAGRDEVSTAPRPVDDLPGTPKAKPRPKRSKAKPNGVSSLLDPGLDDNEAGVESEVAVSITMHELSHAAPPGEPELVVVVAESILSDPVEEIVTEPDFEPVVVSAIPEPAAAALAGALDGSALDGASLDDTPLRNAVFDDSPPEDAALDPAELEAARADEAAFQQAALDESVLEESAREELVREELVREELVREELVREELVREEPVREEPVRAETALEDRAAEAAAAEDQAPEAAALDEHTVLHREHDGESAEAESEPPPAALETVIVVEPAASATARKPAKPGAGKARVAAAKPRVSSAKTRPAAKKTAKPGAKALAKKAAAKKAPAKKAAAKKVSAKKSGAKITPAKKAPAKKAAVRTSGVKKTSAKKSAAKKVGPKKPAQRRR